MVYGIILILIIAAAYFLVQQRKRNSYTGIATATIIREENPITIKPYQVQLVFSYVVDGTHYQGTAVRTKESASKVGEEMTIAYDPKKPEKYLVE